MMPSHLDALSWSLNENIYCYHKQRRDQDYDCVHMYVLFALHVYLNVLSNSKSSGFPFF